MTARRKSNDLEVSLRTCIGCQIIDKKENLARLAMLPDNHLVIDENHNMPGRGTYVCDLICLKKALERKKLNKAFRQKIDPEQLISQLKTHQ
ncbi:YlxR family protein [Patescibacteria group bacterium]|nr:YlxR family protein [Patescibacteria group bacterium]MBU1868647.1 YlxR family protein [Patescibacteria group bacterium]